MLLDNQKHREITDTDRESARRAMETKDAKPRNTIILTLATQNQVNIALYNDEHSNPTIDLAKQGLYNGNDIFTIFHPENREKLAQLILENGGEKNFDKNAFRREDFTKIIDLASANPSILYVN